MKRWASFQFLLVNVIASDIAFAGKLCDFAEKFPCKGKRCYLPYEKDNTTQQCPQNMVPGNGSCLATCQDPNNVAGCVIENSTHKTCVCAQGYYMNGTHCVQPEQCRCYLPTIGRIITDGESYFNNNCSARYTCIEDQLVLERNYRCCNNATCKERAGVIGCYHDDGFLGNGTTCIKEADCYELYMGGDHSDGVYTIYPGGWKDDGFQVYCEMSTDGGGWTVIQRRTSYSVNFNRSWTEYKNGFASPFGDHWLGNDKIHALTRQKNYQLRVDLLDTSDTQYYALYSYFNITDEDDNYRLWLDNYSGNSGNDAMKWNSQYQFSTYDHVYKGTRKVNCADKHGGGWWYRTNDYDHLLPKSDDYSSYRFYCFSGYEDNSSPSYESYDFYDTIFGQCCGYCNVNGLFWYASSDDKYMKGAKMKIRAVE